MASDDAIDKVFEEGPVEREACGEIALAFGRHIPKHARLYDCRLRDQRSGQGASFGDRSLIV